MALANYSDLQAAVADFSNRTDLTAAIPNFIALAEADLNSQLNTRGIETDSSLTAVANSRFITLPAGFREPQNLWIEWGYGRGTPLRFVTPELLVTYTSSGIPLNWCIDGTKIAFERPAQSNYAMTLRMLGALSLSALAPTNLILTNYPNVYLFGALKEAASYLRDSQAEQAWSAKYNAALSLAKAKENRTKSLTVLSTEVGVLGGSAGRSGFNIARGY